jgi:hypothetical protein
LRLSGDGGEAAGVRCSRGLGRGFESDLEGFSISCQLIKCTTFSVESG